MAVTQQHTMSTPTSTGISQTSRGRTDSHDQTIKRLLAGPNRSRQPIKITRLTRIQINCGQRQPQSIKHQHRIIYRIKRIARTSVRQKASII